MEMQIQQVEIARLIPHPKNANVMAQGTMAKLRRHIEKTGRYEPLIVRPHRTGEGCFELINGHHRKEILEALGHTHAACVVWELDDAETLLLLATVNRLGGEDAPGKRLDLLEAVAAAMEVSSAELARWLPEDEATLVKVLADQEAPRIAEVPELADMPEPFTVFLQAREKKRLLEALGRTASSPAVALMKWVDESMGKIGLR
jgi:ParB-like chromosome segregation protein Spo0J